MVTTDVCGCYSSLTQSNRDYVGSINASLRKPTQAISNIDLHILQGYLAIKSPMSILIRSIVLFDCPARIQQGKNRSLLVGNSTPHVMHHFRVQGYSVRASDPVSWPKYPTLPGLRSKKTRRASNACRPNRSIVVQDLMGDIELMMSTCRDG